MKRKRRYPRRTLNKKSLFVTFFFISLVILIPTLGGFKKDEVKPTLEKSNATPVAVPVEIEPPFPVIPIQNWTLSPSANEHSDDIPVGAMMFVDLTDGEILLNKNGTDRVFPASTTKLMTALLAYEKASSEKELDRPLIVIKDSTLDIPWDSHIAHLAVGDRLSVRQALYATLLESGNDAANSLAEYVSGSLDQFVDLMNLRAEALGLSGTQFKNAHGYSDPEHYTTAQDMARITSAFGNYPELVKIAGTYEYEAKFEDKDGKMKRRWWYHLGSAINERSVNYSDLVKATKTGYTDESGYTMVFLMEKDKKKYALVTMQAKSGQTFPTLRLIEHFQFGRPIEVPTE